MAIDIYDQRAEKYSEYANGSCEFDELIAPPGDSGQFAAGDRKTWELLKDSVSELVLQRTPLRILDLGCGDGVWSLRLARWLASEGIAAEILLVDASRAMLDVAARYVEIFQKRNPTTGATFELHEADICTPWTVPLLRDSWDVVLCLHTVLNHVTGADRTQVLNRLFSLHANLWALSVKPPGGPMTLFAMPMSDVLVSRQYADEIVALDRQGNFHQVPASPLSAHELRAAFTTHGLSGRFYALEVFTSRFLQATQGEESPSTALLNKLNTFDEEVSTDPDFMDHANHILNIVTGD